MPAPEYVEHLMAWVQGNVDNESMFPSRIGTMNLALPSHLLNSPISVLSIDRNRCAVPQNLSDTDTPNLQAPLPSLRPYLLPPLPGHRPVGSRTTSQHQFQTLRALH